MTTSFGQRVVAFEIFWGHGRHEVPGRPVEIVEGKDEFGAPPVDLPAFYAFDRSCCCCPYGSRGEGIEVCPSQGGGAHPGHVVDDARQKCCPLFVGLERNRTVQGQVDLPRQCLKDAAFFIGAVGNADVNQPVETARTKEGGVNQVCQPISFKVNQ